MGANSSRANRGGNGGAGDGVGGAGGDLPVPNGTSDYAQVQHNGVYMTFHRYSPYAYPDGRPYPLPPQVRRKGDDGAEGGQQPMPEFQHTRTLRNDVNLIKKSVEFKHSVENPDLYELSFTCSVLATCTITVDFCAREALDDNVTTFISSNYHGPPLPPKVLAPGLKQRCADSAVSAACDQAGLSLGRLMPRASSRGRS